jgi:hypothetical protein
MKRVISTFILGATIFASTAHAFLTEVITTIPAKWVERDGSHTFYGINNGPCGSAIFGVSKSLANFTAVSDDMILAMVKSYKVSMVVEACDGTKNTVTFSKVCRDPAFC